jgi:glycosyltransferase involved in cell wall biosynthesis
VNGKVTTESDATGRFAPPIQGEPFVSIVTPFYNTHEFLGGCIESVLKQQYRNWEYVLVNNCSTDGSEKIAAQYASRFPEKIRLVHTQSFLTQVQNYNFALSCISPESKYCKMVQADDWLFPECVSSMVEVGEEYPSVGIVAAYRLEGDEVRLAGLPYPSPRIAGRDACRYYFLRNIYLFGSPTSILLRSEAVRDRNPFFDQRYAPFEDGHVCFEILRNWDFGFVHQVLTYSRWSNDGIMSRVRGFGLEPFLNLTLLVAHGQHFLSREEYRRRLHQAERRYFLYLTQSACALRQEPKEFWDFHRDGLAAINYSFDWKIFLRWLPRAVVEKTWSAVWRKWDRESMVFTSAA